MKKHSTRLPVITAVFTLFMLTCTAGVLCTSGEHFILHDECGLADPEYENRVLNAAESALSEYLSMGYKSPVNISDPENISLDNKIDIYVRDLPGSTDGGKKVYGSAEIKGKNGYGYIEITDDAGAQLEFAVAHEVFHTIQDACDIQKRKHPWIEEGTAELMAGKMYNPVSGYEQSNWENVLFNCPEKSLFTRSYDATLFWVYIAGVYGDSKILEIWQTLADHSLNGIDGVKKALPDFDADFTGFSEWLYLNYSENRDKLIHYYSGNSTLLPADNIEPYGAHYGEINNTAPSWSIIKHGEIKFEKKSTRTKYSIKLLRYRGDTLEQIYETGLSGSNKTRAIEIPDMQNCSKIIFIISRLDNNPSYPADLSLGEGPALAAQADIKKGNALIEISGAMLAVAALFFLKRKKV